MNILPVLCVGGIGIFGSILAIWGRKTQGKAKQYFLKGGSCQGEGFLAMSLKPEDLPLASKILPDLDLTRIGGCSLGLLQGGGITA